MKTLKQLTLFLSLLLIIGTSQATIKSKNINKSFSAHKDLSIKINNRYGKIQVKNWNQPSIEFTIKISVESKSTEKASSMLDNIYVDFTHGEHYLSVETIFGELFGVKKLSNNLFNKGKITIDYIVKAPTNLTLEIIQRNGNLFMDKYNGPLKINLTDGEFTAYNIMGENKMKFRNAGVEIENLGLAKIDLINTELHIKNGQYITAESHDSQIYIRSIGTLNLKSSRDKIELEQVENLYGTSSLSRFKIIDLGSELDYDLKLGHMNIFNVHHLFNFIKLDSKFTNLGLNFMKNSYFNVEINHKTVKLNYPDSFNLRKRDTPERNTFLTSGIIGKGKSPSQVKIRANNCKINLN